MHISSFALFFSSDSYPSHHRTIAIACNCRLSFPPPTITVAPPLLSISGCFKLLSCSLCCRRPHSPLGFLRAPLVCHRCRDSCLLSTRVPPFVTVAAGLTSFLLCHHYTKNRLALGFPFLTLPPFAIVVCKPLPLSSSILPVDSISLFLTVDVARHLISHLSILTHVSSSQQHVWQSMWCTLYL